MPDTDDAQPGRAVLRLPEHAAATPCSSDFGAHYAFALDDFQVRACQEIEDGRGVLVAAPTGSGKTIVGEFAIHLALATGRKAFYTTPIKALSNQKYNDLVARYGEDQVGLLTGDNSVNGEAPVVVMTTEVLRNMLYAGSRTLLGLGFVVMDEVHYLADRDRGAVWEEIIIHLPESVALVSLSATVSNAEEFGEWLETVRGDTTTIVEERRPVPLYQHVMVGRRLHDLFAELRRRRVGRVREGGRAGQPRAGPDRPRRLRQQPADARPPFAAQGQAGLVEEPAQRRQRPPGLDPQPGRRDRPARPRGPAARDRVRLQPGRLRRRGHAVPVRRRPPDHARRSATRSTRSSRSAVAHLPDDDLHVLGYHDFLDGLTRGVAAHHAGMLPAFKECVEQLFVRGLCKVVFATETLALGINMPARTVVIEKLSKWNGETHADITPGEYTQLTGRAGRRGLDVEGHGVVLWQPGMNPRELAGLASTRTYPLRSSFRPSYNMAVNLVHQFGRERVARAAGAVLRAVPGRQGGRRAGPAAAQERGRPRRLPRGRDLRPRRLHGVRRAPPPDLRPREGGRPGASGRPARGGRWTRCRRLQARRRDRGARRQVRRLRRGRRPRAVAATSRGRTSSPPSGRRDGWR